MTAPKPTVCPRCEGSRLVVRLTAHLEPVQEPCPGCCCVICGEVSSTPPECLACFVAEDTHWKRRADV